MDSFVVSARKYRPSKFDEVVGQQLITTTLKNSIKNNHLAQSFLFCGPRGVGKTTCARILAKIINCAHHTEEVEACNECDSCKSFNQNSSFNIHELDAASNNSVDDIRNLIDQVRYPPQSGKYKIYIIDEVHMLSQSAFNAFLKTLEEPPSYAIFILATTEKQKIIPTILSRCQIFDFNRIQQDDIYGHLDKISQKENVSYEAEGLHIIAQKADGSLRDALSIFDRLVSYSSGKIIYVDVLDNLNVLDYDYYFKLTAFFLSENTSGALNLFNEILQKGFDGDVFINGMAAHYRDLLICKDPETIDLLHVSEALKGKYEEQAAITPTSFLINAINICNQCDVHYRMSKNQRLHVELSLIKLAYLNATIDMGATMILQEGDLKKKQPTPKANLIETKPSPPGQAATSSSSEKDLKSIEKSDGPKEGKVIEEKKQEEKSTPQATNDPEEESTYSSVKITSLEELNSKIDQTNTENNNKEETKEDQDENEDQQGSAVQIDEAALVEHWRAFSEKVKGQNKMSLYSLLHNTTPSVKDKNIVEVVVENKLMEQHLKETKQDLLDFLRNELNEEHLKIEIRLMEREKNEGSEKQPYTAREKFDYMAKQNPEIKKMVKKLDLELEL